MKMTDLLTLTNHHPGFRCSLQWAPTDKDLSFLGSCPFAKGPFTNIPLYATPLRWEKHPHRGLTSSGHVCGHRSEQEIRVHFNVCSTSATVGGCPWSCSLDGHLLSRSTLCSGPSCLCPVLPVPGSACVPSCQSRLCLCPACLSQALPVSCLCSERSSSVLLPSLLPCTPLWAPPHTGRPDDLHGTCCNRKRTSVASLQEGGALACFSPLCSQGHQWAWHTAGCPHSLWNACIHE